ncbi:hypothetical protein [Micromonospora sp. LOL_024]|uniref:hypothetical protein n=1 Tax=Micromonospora sp. LOL_024 TaxID=3345412 RepID=UPI003A848E39
MADPERDGHRRTRRSRSWRRRSRSRGPSPAQPEWPRGAGLLAAAVRVLGLDFVAVVVIQRHGATPPGTVLSSAVSDRATERVFLDLVAGANTVTVTGR